MEQVTRVRDGKAFQAVRGDSIPQLLCVVLVYGHGESLKMRLERWSQPD